MFKWNLLENCKNWENYKDWENGNSIIKASNDDQRGNSQRN